MAGGLAQESGLISLPRLFQKLLNSSSRLFTKKMLKALRKTRENRTASHSKMKREVHMPTSLLFFALPIILLFTQPAFATSYSASVAFDLASLTFSGIPISFSTVIPPGTFAPFENDTTAEQRNTFIRGGSSVSSHSILSPTWQNWRHR
jgi:hypothetical protein